LLSNADIFADFSSFQAMGLTALEAMACACAVIVPRNGGTEEYAKNNVNSLVIDTSNKQECIDALNLLIRDDTLRNKLSVKALEDACQFYPEKSAYKFLQNVFDYE
jgi:glycosyltransferase involved in cell wall biosynthesis